MSKTLKIGIIGSGGIAGAHVKAYRELADVEIVAVADAVPGKAAQFIDFWQIPSAQAFDDYRKLLELELDGVSICTPNVAHHRTTVDSLLAGKHVMLEKPMSVTLDEAIEMAQTSKKTGFMLNVGFQPRYDPNMKIIQDVVQSGQLGKVYYVETGGGRRRGMPGGLKVTPAGKGPWSGVFDGNVGSITYFHDVLGHHTESLIPLTQHKKNLFHEKVRDFAQAVREGKPAPIPGEQIVRNQAIIDGIIRSSLLKREVTIELPN